MGRRERERGGRERLSHIGGVGLAFSLPFLLLTSVSARCVEALCLKTSWDLLLWPVFRHLPRTLIPVTIGTARLADRAKGFAERRAASAEPKRPRTFWAWFLWCLYHLNNWEMEPLVPEQKHKLCLSSQVWTLPGLLLFFYLFTDFLQCKSFWKVPRDTCSVGTVFTLSFRNKCQELACLHNLTILPPHWGWRRTCVCARTRAHTYIHIYCIICLKLCLAINCFFFSSSHMSEEYFN